MAEHDSREEKKMNRNADYDRENDILRIHKGFSEDEKFKGNIDAGDLILDMSTKGNVKGVEILNATRFLGEFSITKETLEDLKDADFSAQTGHDSIMISLTIKAKTEQKAKIAVAIAN